MKVLKLKDPTQFKELLIKRGNHMIIPVIDGDGNYILGYEVLLDPMYSDITEKILDCCEVIEHKPLDVDSMPDTPIEETKGEFRSVFLEAKNVEEAVELYYDSKKGFITKMVDAVVEFFS